MIINFKDMEVIKIEQKLKDMEEVKIRPKLQGHGGN